jgi:polyphosphate kinase
MAEPLRAGQDLADPALYIDRELSQLDFFRRVLEEAQEPANPLLERVKFLSIVSSNLAEFFMVRVSGLKQQIEAGVSEITATGLSPSAQLTMVRTAAQELMLDARTCMRRLLPLLERERSPWTGTTNKSSFPCSRRSRWTRADPSPTSPT